MNAQTLNRMVKASYYAPNGAQLRKACYGLMAVNSRRASMGDVSLEQIAELPKQEQAEVKFQIVQEGLGEGSAEDQAKLAGIGLKDVKMYLKQEGITPEQIEKDVKKADPIIVKSLKPEVHDLKGAVAVAGAIAKSRSFEEIFGFLDLPIDWVQTKYQDFNWFKYNLIVGSLAVFFGGLGAGIIGGAGAGMAILIGIIMVAGYAAFSLFLNYFFGDVIRWVNKRIAMVTAWSFLLNFRILSFALKTLGKGLDEIVGGIKGAWSSFFSKQAKIAMQSPEFRRAYYNI
jgi:hypothetical protein